MHNSVSAKAGLFLAVLLVALVLAESSFFTAFFTQAFDESLAARYLGKTGEDFAGPGNAGPNGSADYHVQLKDVPTGVTISKVRVSNGSFAWERPYNGVDWGIEERTSGTFTDLWFEPNTGTSPFTVALEFSDGTAATTTSNYGVPSAHHLQVVSSILSSDLGTNEGIHIIGNYAYVTANVVDRLNVIDISNPLAPVIVGGVSSSTLLNGAEDVFVFGNYAYVTTEAAGTNRLTIVDISSSTAPVIAGSIQDNILLTSTEDVFVANGYVYVTAEGADRLTIIDTADPSNPVIVGSVYDGVRLNAAEGLWVAGDYAYVAAESGNSLSVIDVSDPANPVIVGHVTSGLLTTASGLSVSGNYAYVTSELVGKLVIIDISNPASPVIVGSLTSSYLIGTDNVDVLGDYAYVTAVYGDSVVRVDVSDKTKPYVAGYIVDSRLQFSNGIRVVSPYAYVTAELFNGSPTSRFTVVRIPDPTLPDTTAPSVTITAPLDNADISAGTLIAISADASDAGGVSLIDIFLDATPIVSCSGVTSCGTNYDSTPLALGEHTITANAYDPAGNMGSTTVTFDLVSPGTPDLTAGLIGHWTFDEVSGTSAADSSASNLHGTLADGATLNANGPAWVIGVLNNALQFDGVDDHVRLTQAETVTDNLGPLSISAWIRPTAFANNKNIAGKTGSGGGFEWLFGLSNTTALRFIVTHSSISLISQSADNTLTPNEWQHVVMIWDGGSNATTNVNHYKNGVLLGKGTVTNGSGSVSRFPSLPFTMGSSYYGTYFDFTGSIDDVRLYNRVLSAEEAGLLFEGE